MRRITLVALTFLFSLTVSRAQTTALDFTMTDCNGNMHNLYSELDSGYVVIMEFFMLSCTPCIDAGDALEPMWNKLKATCSNKIRFYHIGYTNTYNCTQISNWVTTNGYTSVPFDSGGVQTAYYGGMGMPTVAIAGGTSHKVLYSVVGFMPGDTAIAADSIRSFFGCSTASVYEPGSVLNSVQLFPNPARDLSSLSLDSKQSGLLSLHLLDLNGRTVHSFPARNITSGPSSAELDLKGIPSGFYTLRGVLKGETFHRKIAVIR